MASSKRNEIRAAIQQRVKRFSAFELLGLDTDQSLAPPVEQAQPPPFAEILTESTMVSDPIYGSDISDGLTVHHTVRSDGTSDGLTVHQTVGSDVPSDPTISDHLIQGGSDSTSHQFAHPKEDFFPSSEGTKFTTPVPLAPLQWRVWQVLRNAERKVVSYHGLASQVIGSIPGIRQAIRVIEREGGILSRCTVREKTQDGAVLQGFRFVLNQSIVFHPISALESHKLQQRKVPNHVVANSLIQPRSDISDGLRMYVGNKIHTYVPELLRLCPPDWQIREQTLVKLVEAFPEMSALEFRRSLRYLVEQSKTSKQEIKNPNAWLKAAFERNGGPLITERMIEVQLDQRGSKTPTNRPPPAVEIDPDLEMLRRYVAASIEDKATIDRLADERVGRLLETVAADKHDGIREQARIKCAREFFAGRGKK